MPFSRRLTRHAAVAALLAACVAATGTNPVLAAGQADAQAGTGPGADAAASGEPLGGRAPGDGAQRGFADHSSGDHGSADQSPADHSFGNQSSGNQSFGRSRPGVPGLDGPTPPWPPQEGPPHGPGGFGLFGHLHRLHLSEAQQDKLFAIMHDAAPRQRSQAKAQRKAHEALRTLGAAPQFDEARARAAARELGQAVADGALLHARLESEVLALLTPEQREQLRQHRPPGPPHHP
jgi:protein CpxP